MHDAPDGRVVSTIPESRHRSRTQREFLKDVGVLTAGNIVIGALAFLQGIVIARWFGPHLYGVAALVTAYPLLVNGFLDLRSSEASVKYLAEFHAQKEPHRALGLTKLSYTLDFAVAVATIVLVAATGKWIEGHVLRTPGTAILMILFAASFVPAGLTKTSYSVLAVARRFSAVAAANVVGAGLAFLSVIGALAAGWGLAGVVAAMALGRAVPGVWMTIMATRKARELWGTSPVGGVWRSLSGRRREILGFFAFNDLLALLGVIPKQLDIILLGHFRGPTETGFYKLAKGLVSMISQLVGPVSSVSYATLANLWGTKRWGALLHMVRNLHVRAGLPVGAAALLSVPILPTVIQTVAGPAYGPAGVVAQVLVAAQVPALVFFSLGSLLLIWGQVKVRLAIRGVTVLVMLTGFLIAAPRWGAVGMAWVALGTQVLGAILLLTWIVLRGARTAEAAIPGSTLGVRAEMTGGPQEASA